MKNLFSGPQITLSQLLSFKEQKTYEQKKHLENCKSLLCMSVNMPGNIKQNCCSDLFFNEGAAILEQRFSGKLFKFSSQCGPYLIIESNEEPFELKKQTLKLENEFKWSEMLDIDVLTKEGSIERSSLGEPPRKCFVCGHPAKICARQSKHTETEIKKAITEHFNNAYCQKLGRICTEALLKEARCTPKPGLVDMNNNGSHNDMNIELFEKSAVSLREYFCDCTSYGLQQKSFIELRKLGLSAEETMFNTTNGINTHQGAIFSLGLMAYSCGRTLSSDPVEICTDIAGVCSQLKNEKQTGARKSASEGFSGVTGYALPLYKELSTKFNENDSLCLTLLGLISKTYDTNIVRRSNEETLKTAQKKAAEVLDIAKKTGDFSPVYKLDEWFIKHNISPGGSADLLALLCALKSNY